MKLYSLKDISSTYGISVSMLKKLIYSGHIEHIRIGVKYFLTEEMIDTYIEKNRSKNV